jgi:tetratricopeptide (TPR) repeat protein
MDMSMQKNKKLSYGAKRPDTVPLAMTRFRLAVSLFQNGRLSEAKTLFNEILSFDPEHAESWYFSALIADQEGLGESAINYLSKALEIDPKNLKYLYTLGDIYYALSYLNEGIKLFKFITSIDPQDYNGFYNLAVFQQKKKLYDESLENFRKVLELDKDNVNSIYNIGNILIDSKDYVNATAYFKKVIERQPNSDDALNNLGFLQLESRNYEKALGYLNKAILINPNNFSALNNLGKIYNEKSLYSDALKYFDRAIKLKSDYVDAYSNRGVVFKELKLYEASLNDYDKAILLDSKNPEANYKKAILLLHLQEFSSGWNLYHWRWRINNQFSKKLETEIPSWDGRVSGGKIRILFWAEQGIGDEIFYFGMLRNFSDIEAKITVAVDIRLHTLFERSMPGIDFIDKNEIFSMMDESAFDYQAPIGDLGLLCGVDKLIEYKAPKKFLSENSLRCSDLKKNNPFLSGKFICGLSWKSTNKDIGLSKSLELIELSPLLLIKNVEFVSLQYGATKDEIEFIEKELGIKIHVINDLDIYNDIDGLVALISLCNLVVTTSNITAHLAGAIGKKSMVLMPFSKGKIWYWHSGVGQSLWYPSLELVSQETMNDWTDPINKCKEWVLAQI